MKTIGLFVLMLFSCNCLARDNLRVVTEELPPYQIVIDGQLVAGSSYKVVKEMLKRADFDARIELLPWARAFTIASTEPNVVIFSISRSPSREKLFRWLSALARQSYYFYALAERDDLDIYSLDDMLNYTVTTVRDGFEAEELVKMGFIEGQNLILTRSYKDAWHMVLLGRADFTYSNQIFKDQIFTPDDPASPIFKRSFSINQAADLYIAVSLNTEPLIIEKLNESLQSMKDDGTFARLMSVQ